MPRKQIPCTHLKFVPELQCGLDGSLLTDPGEPPTPQTLYRATTIPYETHSEETMSSADAFHAFRSRVEESAKARLRMKQYAALVAYLECFERRMRGEFPQRSVNQAAAAMLRVDRKTFDERLQRGIANLAGRRYDEVNTFLKRRTVRQKEILSFIKRDK